MALGTGEVFAWIIFLLVISVLFFAAFGTSSITEESQGELLGYMLVQPIPLKYGNVENVTYYGQIKLKLIRSGEFRFLRPKFFFNFFKVLFSEGIFLHHMLCRLAQLKAL